MEITNINRLSTQQRKRLTIVVKLVANPSIIFLDEPSSGLDVGAYSLYYHPCKEEVKRYMSIEWDVTSHLINYFEVLLGLDRRINPGSFEGELVFILKDELIKVLKANYSSS
ncbi:pleiotropic drug resistance protein 1-like protein [Tanacetum coccineum]